MSASFVYTRTLFNFVPLPTVAAAHVARNLQHSLKMNDFYCFDTEILH